jgi:hypothetical protein
VNADDLSVIGEVAGAAFVCAPNAFPLVYPPCFWRARVYTW